MAEYYETPFPMDDDTWNTIADALELAPQQKRVVELTLCGMQDAEIAEAMQIAIPTISTYRKRIFERVGIENRMQLVLRIFAMAQGRM